MPKSSPDPRAVDRTRRRSFDLIISVAMLVASAILLLWLILAAGQGTGAARRTDDYPPIRTGVSLAGAPILGDPAATLAMIVFSDFACPHCATFVLEVLPELKANYVDSGLLQVRFRYLSTASTGTVSEQRAKAVHCLGLQGRFWQVYERSFAAPHELASIIGGSLDLDAAGGNTNSYRECLGARPSGTEDDKPQEMGALGVSSAPGFFIGRVNEAQSLEVRAVFSGGVPFTEFRKTFGVLGVR